MRQELRVRYQITVSQVGTIAANDLVITDPIPLAFIKLIVQMVTSLMVLYAGNLLV